MENNESIYLDTSTVELDLSSDEEDSSVTYKNRYLETIASRARSWLGVKIVKGRLEHIHTLQQRKRKQRMEELMQNDVYREKRRKRGEVVDRKVPKMPTY